MAHTYPYRQGDQIVGAHLNNDFELSAALVPPSGVLGGAGQFKPWMDISVNPPALRIATAARAAAGVYNANEWATLGTLDIANRRFNFQGGWSGDLNVTGNINSSGPGPNSFHESLWIYGATGSDGLLIYNTGQTAYFAFTPQAGNIGQLTYFVPPSGGGTLKLANAVQITNDLTVTGVVSTTQAFNFLDSGGSQWWDWTSAGGFAQLQAFNTATPALKVSTAGDLYANNNILTQHGGLFYWDTGDSNQGWQLVAHGGISYLGTTKPSGYVIAMNYSDLATQINGSLHCGTLGVAGQITSTDVISTPSQIRADGGLGYKDGVNGQGWQLFATSGASYITTTKSNGWCIQFDWNTYATNFNGNINVNGPTLSCQNIDAKNDVAAEGVFRHFPVGAGSKGARLECFGGNWDSMSLALNNGSFVISPDNGASGYIFGPGNVFSDARLKENIRDSEVNALEMLRQTPVRTFDWNDEGRKLMPWASPVECGFVAQELEETIPLAVAIAPFADDMRYINDQLLLPYLIRAIQQLADRLDAGGL